MSGVALDGTLSAVIATDRLASSEASDGPELLRRRLTVFYGYFALLGVLGTLAGRVGRFPVETDPRSLARLLDTQAAHALVQCAVFLALRLRLQDARLLRSLDVLATASTSVSAAVGLAIVPYAVTVDVSVVAFFILFFALRAALVPSKPWRATLIAAVSAVPVGVGLWTYYRGAHLPDPSGATFAATRALACGVAGVFLVTKTIYGLRRVVEQAVQLGQYVVHEKIGEGGMGTVYRASHAMLKRPTAIKLIAPERASDTASARFEREVLAASRLSHPNNVAIYDFGRTRGGIFYYAMELLDGQDLARLVEREGPQPVSRTLHVLRQLAGALAEAHDAGLVHRDVKPANIMLCTRGGVPDFVKVLDFGLVKDNASSDLLKITAQTSIAGTPLYMAPEAVVAPDTVGPAADISHLVEVCMHHVHSAPEPASRHAPAVPPALDALVARCLDKTAERRPARGGDLGGPGGTSRRANYRIDGRGRARLCDCNRPTRKNPSNSFSI